MKISKTGLDYIQQSPADYYYRFLRPDREPYVKTKDQVFDEALRVAVFTPSDFQTTYVKLPELDRRKPLKKMEYNSLLEAADASGQILLSGSDYDSILSMRSVVRTHKSASILTASGQPGTVMEFKEQISGATVVFKPHHIYKNSLIYLSSTSDASAEGFSKQAWEQKLHKRAAIQMDGTGIRSFIFILIEKKPPYKIGIHILDDRSIELGRQEYIENCRTYSECLQSGSWPGLPEKITPVSLPEYVFKK